MKPYYADESVTLYLGDSREALADMPDLSVAAVITDPPYGENTHRMAKTNKGKGHGTRAVNFDSITVADLDAAFEQMGRVSRRWVIATLDYKHAFHFDAQPPTGLRMLRVGVWRWGARCPALRALLRGSSQADLSTGLRLRRAVGMNGEAPNSVHAADLPWRSYESPPPPTAAPAPTD